MPPKPPHQAVACAECHIAPGATGWLKAKMNGTSQLMAVVFNNYPRPIESAMEDNKLVSSAETCEQCHARDKPIGPRLRVITSYKDDETNTRTETVLLMHIGGHIHARPSGTRHPHPLRCRRQEAPNHPRGGIREHQTGASRTYLASGSTADSVRSLPVFEMQCVDCHNRASHAFELPDRAVNQAMAAGQIAASLPFVKKESVELLKAGDARNRIPAALSALLSAELPGRRRKQDAEIQAAGAALAAIYRAQRVFRSQSHLGNLSEQSRPHRCSGLFPLPRRSALDG